MTIGEFLLALATDRELLERFGRDPRSVIENADLGDQQRELLLAGELRELRIKIEAEINVGGETLFIHTICIPTICKPPPPPPPPNPSQD